MRNTSALSLGFGGCGTTLPDMRRQLGLGPGQVAAALDALGALLMAKSSSCLPVKHDADPQTIIQQAQAWKLIPSRTQVRVLERLMELLTSPPPGRSHVGESYQQPMLPLEMGAWDSDRPLPSCLGMLIILASYARLTEAPFLIGSVQRMSAEPATLGLERLLADVYRWSAAHLPAAFYHDGLAVKLQGIIDDARSAMNLMTNRQLFHGALVIRLSDGRWASVDPYMHNLSYFDPKTRPIDRLYSRLMLDPATAASVQGRGYWDHLPELEQQLHEVYGIIDYLLRLPRDFPLIGLSQQLCHLAKAHAGISMTSPDDVLRFAFTEPPHREAPTLEASRVLLANLSTSRLQTELRQRLLMVLLNVWAEQAYDTTEHTRSSEPHHALMLSSPARTLGLWTVINLRHRSQARVLAADLLQFSRSDVVLYNALLDQRLGRTTRTEDRLIRERVADISQAPDRLVHPLLLNVLG